MAPFSLIKARADLRAKLAGAMELLEASKEAPLEEAASLIEDLESCLSDADGLAFALRLELGALASLAETQRAAAKWSDDMMRAKPPTIYDLGPTREMPVDGRIA